jgi:hypothetical protein
MASSADDASPCFVTLAKDESVTHESATDIVRSGRAAPGRTGGDEDRAECGDQLRLGHIRSWSIMDRITMYLGGVRCELGVVSLRLCRCRSRAVLVFRRRLKTGPFSDDASVPIETTSEAPDHSPQRWPCMRRLVVSDRLLGAWREEDGI